MRHDLLPLPNRDPVLGGPLYVSELTSDETGVSIRGRFALPRYAQLDPDQVAFLETFLRNRGMLNGVERDLGISYPTARARLDALLAALGLRGVRDIPEPPTGPPPSVADSEERRKTLDMLERGEISAADAIARLQRLP